MHGTKESKMADHEQALTLPLKYCGTTHVNKVKQFKLIHRSNTIQFRQSESEINNIYT